MFTFANEEDKKNQAWSYALRQPMNIDDNWRRDRCGAVMQYKDYKKRDSEFGWFYVDFKDFDSNENHPFALQWQNYDEYQRVIKEKRNATQKEDVIIMHDSDYKKVTAELGENGLPKVPFKNKNL